MVKSSDKMWSTGEGNGEPLQYSCLENPMNSMKRQKDMTLKDELPRWVGAQYATRDQWRNNSRKNEETWNVRSMNQGKLEVIEQEMARVNINILGISELKWTGRANLIWMTIISTTVGRNPLGEME